MEMLKNNEKISNSTSLNNGSSQIICNYYANGAGLKYPTTATINNSNNNHLSLIANISDGVSACCATNNSVDYSRILAPTLKSTQEQMRNCISIDLLTACHREVNFLRMIDRKAPVLYEKNVVENAIRRYETCWLPAQVKIERKTD